MYENLKSMDEVPGFNSRFSQKDPSKQETAPWSSLVTIRYPDGVTRHERVFDFVWGNLGRICAIDTADEGISLSFATHGETREDALEDSRDILHGLLDLLGLETSMVIEHEIVERPDYTELDARPNLRIVED